MTWPLRIFFSGLLLAQSAAAQHAAVGGRVTLVDSREQSVRSRKEYSGVVVWLEPVGATAPLPPSKKYTMSQKGKKFIPHVLVIPVGAVVDFPNFDPIFHNAFSNFSGQPFDTGLYPPGTSHQVKFHRDGVVRVFCNIHSTMSAVIVAVRTPWFTMTKPDGSFRIGGVNPGEYTLKVWHERAPEATLKGLVRRVRVGEEGLQLEPIAISESGYLEVPHSNKYGHEYPPTAPDQTIYPGARK